MVKVYPPMFYYRSVKQEAPPPWRYEKKPPLATPRVGISKDSIWVDSLALTRQLLVSVDWPSECVDVAVVIPVEVSWDIVEKSSEYSAWAVIDAIKPHVSPVIQTCMDLLNVLPTKSDD